MALTQENSRGRQREEEPSIDQLFSAIFPIAVAGREQAVLQQQKQAKQAGGRSRLAAFGWGVDSPRERAGREEREGEASRGGREKRGVGAHLVLTCDRETGERREEEGFVLFLSLTASLYCRRVHSTCSRRRSRRLAVSPECEAERERRDGDGVERMSVFMSGMDSLLHWLFLCLFFSVREKVTS